MTDESKFMELKKDQLQEYARVAELDDSGTKAEIVQRLLDAGETYEDYELVYGEPVEEVAEQEPAEAEVVSDDAVEESTVETETVTQPEPAPLTEADAEVLEEQDKVVEEDDELVLVKYVGTNAYRETFGKRFSREHPFALLPAGKANKLVERKNFREATAKEAAGYYS
jgi:hypothetical protein